MCPMIYSGGGEKNFMKLPDSLTKRSLLYSVKKTSTEQLKEIGENFYGQGQLSDAADFFSKAQEKQGLEKIKADAINDGDTFLLLKSVKLLGAEMLESDLVQCAQNAEKQSKIRHAITAYERLGDEERVEQLRELVKDDLDIKADAEEDVFIPSAVEEIDEE